MGAKSLEALYETGPAWIQPESSKSVSIVYAPNGVQSHTIKFIDEMKYEFRIHNGASG